MAYWKARTIENLCHQGLRRFSAQLITAQTIFKPRLTQIMGVESASLMKTLLTFVALSLVLICSTGVTTAQTSLASKNAKSPSEQDESVSRNATPSNNNGSESEITSKASSTRTDIYRVGLGDVLDIRLMNSANANRSTLYTVLAGGMIDFPLAGGLIQVAGLTTEEIQTHISTELKRRAVEETSKVSVGVRQYVSHSVTVTGLVGAPGTRILRREAVPLYVVLAESLLRNDAGQVAIMRNGTTGLPLNLNDPQSFNATVISGDVITVTSRPQEFYYIGGNISHPGQKDFRVGTTLLQAILAAGGTSRKSDSKVEISREGGNDRLVTSRFDLKQIKAGTIADPKLQPGDRIEVLR